jgi:transmembrane sensor
MDFTRYSVDDFVGDESFQAFVAANDSEAGRFWQAWLREHPDKQAEADLAYTFVQGLAQARSYSLADNVLPREWARLHRALHPAVPARPRLRSQRHLRLLTGGLTLLVLLAGLGWWFLPASPPAGHLLRYTTASGQQRTLTLPDGSVVVLNGSSTLTTAARWSGTAPREVWLTGEAYFRVVHLAAAPDEAIDAAPAGAKFVVHAGPLAVSVLGTQFDVNSRAGSTKVILNSGRVAVERDSRLPHKKLLLVPGDLVETSPTTSALGRRQVRPALYSGWAQGRLRFQQTPVRDVVQLLRDSYGLQVVVTDSALLRKTIVGEVPTTTPDVLLAALGKVLNSDVVRTGNAVRFVPARR